MINQEIKYPSKAIPRLSKTTRYAVDLFVKNEYKTTLGYSARKTNSALLDYAFDNGDLLVNLDSTNAPEWDLKKKVFTLGDVTIKFGNTENNDYTLQNTGFKK